MRTLKILLMLIVLLAGVAASEYPSRADPGHSSGVSPEDAYVLLDNLLELSEKKGDIKAQLAEYKKWEKVYIKYSTVEKPTELDIKIFLMMVFIAREHYMAHTLEESADDTLAMYRKNPKLFLKVLEANHFLIPSACVQLREYFDLHNRPGKKDFISKNRRLILESLGKELGLQCMEKLLFEYESNQSLQSDGANSSVGFSVLNSEGQSSTTDQPRR